MVRETTGYSQGGCEGEEEVYKGQVLRLCGVGDMTPGDFAVLLSLIGHEASEAVRYSEALAKRAALRPGPLKHIPLITSALA